VTEYFVKKIFFFKSRKKFKSRGVEVRKLLEEKSSWELESNVFEINSLALEEIADFIYACLKK